MAKKAKTGRKSPKSAATKKADKKVAAKKPARTGDTHVNFGLHGITNIVQKVREAGLESEFNKTLGPSDKFVKVQRKSLTAIKQFVASKPALSGLHSEMEGCDCPPDDPYCIYI
jgi:hypothetical protein